MGIGAVHDVFNEIKGILHLADVMVVGRHPAFDGVGTDGLGRSFRKLGNHQAMVEGSRRLHLQTLHEGTVHIRHFQPGDGSDDFKDTLYDGKHPADQHAGEHADAEGYRYAYQYAHQVGIPRLEVDHSHDAAQHHDEQSYKESRPQQLGTISQVVRKKYREHAGQGTQDPELDLFFRHVLLRQYKEAAEHADADGGEHSQQRPQKHRHNQRSHHVRQVEKLIAYVGRDARRHVTNKSEEEQLHQNSAPSNYKSFIFFALGPGTEPIHGH